MNPSSKLFGRFPNCTVGVVHSPLSFQQVEKDIGSITNAKAMSHLKKIFHTVQEEYNLLNNGIVDSGFFPSLVRDS